MLKLKYSFLFIIIFSINLNYCFENKSLLNKIIYNTIDDWFNIVNKQLLIINQYSSYIGWELIINPNDKLIENGIELGTIKSKWRNIRCDESKQFFLNINLNIIETRMLYLLCRGTKFTDYQTKELTKILNKMENIYTMSNVCLPKHFDVCLNIDRIWEFTFLKNFNGDVYFLNLTTVKPKKFKTPTKLHYFNGYISDDYYILEKETNDLIIKESNIQDISLLCFNGEPELETIMTGNFKGFQRNDCMLDTNDIFRWAWESWRMAVGPPIRIQFTKAVHLFNIGANNNGYHDIGEVWQEELEMPSLRTEITKLWNDIKPFYILLHAVMRNSLRKKFRNTEKFEADDLIPAHILGNMWSQNWASYLELIVPFPEMNLEENLKKTNWTTIDMVKRAEDFYSSMGMSLMTNKFWKYSYFEKNNNLSNCHGTAANMYQKNDYRMIVCAQKTLDDFYVIHHEMGHIHYYMSYNKQPPIFQEGTNSAMQETIGDVIFLAAMTPAHLNRLRLIPDKFLFPEKTFETYEEHQMKMEEEKKTEEENLNNLLVDEDTVEYLKELKLKNSLKFLNFPFPNVTKLNKDNHRKSRTEIFKLGNDDYTMNSFDLSLLMRMALTKIPQIPFEYILDIFRWDIFSGKISMTNANDYFWELTRKEQGIREPDENKRDKLFDAGAKFHVPDSTPYVRYFVASFLQAQIFRGLCEVTVFGSVNNKSNKLPMPLHRCDIYGSKRAGKLLKKAMSLGSSVHWTEVLYILTGKREITADALLEYYQPLIKWLEKIVIEENIPLGW